MSKKPHPPKLDEFASLSDERRERNRKIASSRFPKLAGRASVAVYKSANKQHHLLCIKIASDIAQQHGLRKGDRFEFLLHPSGKYVALKPSDRGAALHAQRHTRALGYQTTLSPDRLPAFPVRYIEPVKVDDALVFTLD